jgi:hypothetical protein
VALRDVVVLGEAVLRDLKEKGTSRKERVVTPAGLDEALAGGTASFAHGARKFEPRKVE